MAKVVGDIAVTVGADVSDLVDGMKRAGKSVTGFQGRYARMGESIARSAAKVGAVGLTGAVGLGALSKAAVNAGADLEKLSGIAKSTPENFQFMSEAAKQVGIGRDKMADILKDTVEKIGDFQANGGGPLKDFFEEIAPRVGETAEAFKDLSGTEALQKYATILERANTPQSEMVAHMEALASDASALIPLLANGGAEIQRIGERAKDAGVIMSNDAVKGAADLQAQMGLLTDSMSTTVNQAFLENKEEIKAIVDLINNGLIPAISKLVGFLGTVAEGYAKWGEAYQTLRSNLGLNFEEVQPGQLPATSITPGAGSITDQFGGNSNSPINSLFGGGGSDEIQGGQEGDMLGLGSPDAQQEAYDASLGRLNDFLSRRAEMIVNHAAREVGVTSDTANQIQQIEGAKFSGGLSNAQGFFKTLGTLTKGNSETLLRINKAFGVAQAGVSTAVGAAKALEQPFPLSLAAFAQVMATGAQAISSIKSSSPGNSGIGGGSLSTPSFTQAPQRQETSQSRVVDLQLIGGIPPEYARQMVEAINDAVGDGAEIRLV